MIEEYFALKAWIHWRGLRLKVINLTQWIEHLVRKSLFSFNFLCDAWLQMLDLEVFFTYRGLIESVNL